MNLNLAQAYYIFKTILDFALDAKALLMIVANKNINNE